MKVLGLLTGAVALLALTGAPAAAAEVDPSAAPSGSYQSDPRHAYIVFSYDHMGMSHPHVRWRNWGGELDWNAENPTASSVYVTIDAASVDSGVDEFDGHLRGEKFFDVASHPDITFESTSIERTGPNTGKISGDLTIKGVTAPIVLDAVINGATDDAQGGVYKLGFSATATVKRSEFGITAYVPLVSDEVEISIESEFFMQGDGE